MSTEWYPDIAGRQGPRYVAIADAIGDALASGRLESGMQLPTQRDLARRLNVTIGTVSRAYQEAERRGFVSGEVGRGTYIRDTAGHSARAAGSQVSTGRSVRADSDGGTAALQAGSVVHLFRRSDSAEAAAPPPPKELPPPELPPAAPEPVSDLPRPAPSPDEPHTADRAAEDPLDALERKLARPINLASSRLPDGSDATVRSLLEKILSELDLIVLAGTAVAPGDAATCRSAGRILERLGISAGAREIVLAPSGGAALDAVFAAAARREGAILVEALMDPTLRAVAARHGLRLATVQLDKDGLLPESFELACWSSQARLFLCAPTAHNPTATTLSNERRRAILDIAERYDVTIIEWTGSLPAADGPPGALAALAPHRTIHVADLATCALSGLRLAIVTAPAEMLERIGREIANVHRLLSGVQSGLLHAIAAPGAYDALVRAQSRVLAERRRIFARALEEPGGDALRTVDSHGWLRLPDSWRSGDFAVAAAVQGVLVASADHFMAGRGPVPRAVRLAWGGLGGPEEAAHAGAILGQILLQTSDDGFVAG